MFTGRFAKFAAMTTLMGVVMAGAGAVTSGQTPTTQPTVKEKAKEKAKKAVAAPLDLNKASAEAMVERLPGVGEATAKKIVAGRPYATVDDLAKAGVPARTIDGIRGLVTVAPPPAVVEPSAKPKMTTKAAAPLDLNKASAEAMVERLPGVGEATAKKIVAGRPYATVDDLAKAGVPARTIDGIRSLVTVGPPPVVVESPAVVEPAAKPKMTTKVVAPLDLNKASAEAMVDLLPGVGEATAQKIVAGRPYATVDDLAKAGVPARTIDAIRGLVTVAPPPAVVEPLAKPKTAKEAVAPPGGTTATKGKATTKARLAPGQKVNLNKAPKEELDLLPGIGPVRAQAIIEGRPYKSIEEIKKVKGIKEFEFSQIKEIITVE